MITVKGKAVFGGIASGKIVYIEKENVIITKNIVDDPAKEWDRYCDAKASAIAELRQLYELASEEIGETDAQIFYIHELILDDSQYELLISEYIKDKHCNAEYAVSRTAQRLCTIMTGNSSDYIRERQADVMDVSDRIMRHLQQRSGDDLVLDEKSIICADDLMPSETVMLDKSMVIGFCTRRGSTNSHTAILARTMNIPAIIGMGKELMREYDGRNAVIDGYTGTLFIEPDEDTLRMLSHRAEEEGRKRELLLRLKGRKNITRDGREFAVYANIGSLEDAAFAIENDAGGIGLFRTEFMYMKRETIPDEEELFYNFRRAVEDMKGKRVVIRTLDIGAEKQVPYIKLEREANPAMGMRAIRLCLRRPDIFKPQLRAMLRASAYGKLAILLPMIIDLEELIAVKSIIAGIKDELIGKGIPFDENVEVGVMIETPASVMVSDLLAREADFFSIGTNDLEQYTLAVDRQSPDYETLVPQNHLAVLRMIKVVCENAHVCGKKVCICGELGADLSLTEIFLDMHVDALSVTPTQILPVRRMIRSLNLSDRRQIHDNIQRVLKY
ncbi:MAG: phosphoenolpyruvate--protein phosphotransferase [Ruminococcus sp.]|nr:phosphoenolpyruvate--protein phosphotransferase [Ruminococcus sp.]